MKRSWGFYIFQIIVALILPLIIIGNIEFKVQKKILNTLKYEVTPIITYITGYQDKHGNLPNSISDISIKANTLNNISYTYSLDTFILETEVASIDIDRTKIFYDSRDKRWYQFHNDEYQYYLDKTKRPQAVENYISFKKRDNLLVSSLKKIDGKWISTSP